MDRGFHDYYGLISGAAHYFDIRRTKQAGLVRHFARGNEEYLPPAEGWYMTDALTDCAVRMLEQHGAGNKPFFLYLAYMAPHWPLHAWPAGIKKKGEISHQPAHIIDIMATFLEIAGIEYPDNFHEKPIRASKGKSLLPVFKGLPDTEQTGYCWEHLGSVAIREDSWKLVAEKDQPWELYSLSDDRTELNDLITINTEVAYKLHQNWLAWAEQCGVKIQDIHRQMD